MSTFVTVGNGYRPFTRLLDEVARLAASELLPPPVFVQHGHTPFASRPCVAVPFLSRPEFAAQVRHASLVIAHGGSGTFIEAVRAGKIPVVMPRLARYDEIVDNHQLELVRFLAQAGRIVLAEEPGDLATAIDRALLLQAERAQRAVVRSEPPLVALVRQALQDWDRA